MFIIITFVTAHRGTSPAVSDGFQFHLTSWKTSPCFCKITYLTGEVKLIEYITRFSNEIILA